MELRFYQNAIPLLNNFPLEVNCDIILFDVYLIIQVFIIYFVSLDVIFEFYYLIIEVWRII